VAASWPCRTRGRNPRAPVPSSALYRCLSLEGVEHRGLADLSRRSRPALKVRPNVPKRSRFETSREGPPMARTLVNDVCDHRAECLSSRPVSRTGRSTDGKRGTVPLGNRRHAEKMHVCPARRLVKDAALRLFEERSNNLGLGISAQEMRGFRLLPTYISWAIK